VGGAGGAPGGEADAWGAWLAQQFTTGPRRPVRFALAAGRFEDATLLKANRRFRAALEAAGYPVHYTEFAGGHDDFSWQGVLAEQLLALLGRPDGEPERAAPLPPP
jgi:enterochelin esterase family protein